VGWVGRMSVAEMEVEVTFRLTARIAEPEREKRIKQNKENVTVKVKNNDQNRNQS
jgi:hypothetical protein